MATVQSPNTNAKGLNLAYDRDLLLSASQVVDTTADVPSTNSIDLGSIDMPKGKAIKVNIFIEALVGTFTMKLASKNGSAPAVDDQLLNTVVSIANGLGVISMVIPQTAEGDYVRLFVTAGTSATFSAIVTTEV